LKQLLCSVLCFVCSIPCLLINSGVIAAVFIVAKGGLHFLHGLMLICALSARLGYPLMSSVWLSFATKIVRFSSFAFIPILVVLVNFQSNWQTVLQFAYFVIELLCWIYEICSELSCLKKRNERSTFNRFKVLSYNIQSGTGMDRSYDLNRTAQEIVSFDADVVCLQEVDRNCQVDCYDRPLPEARRVDDQPQKLSELTRMRFVHFEPKTTQFGGEYGSAVLSKHEIMRTDAWKLKTSAEQYHGSNLFFGPLDQVAISIELKPEGFEYRVIVICVHFGCDASGIEQINEFIEVNNYVEERLSEFLCHVVICGDFNSGSPTVDVAKCLGWKDSWTEAEKRETSRSVLSPFYAGTHTSKFPIAKLDFIFYKTLHRRKTLKLFKIQPKISSIVSTMTSDHLPISTVFEEIEITS
jgi:endonuclease/exonuclease/phosphatase family metal-dependent hydrolase